MFSVYPAPPLTFVFFASLLPHFPSRYFDKTKKMFVHFIRNIRFFISVSESLHKLKVTNNLRNSSSYIKLRYCNKIYTKRNHTRVNTKGRHISRIRISAVTVNNKQGDWQGRCVSYCDFIAQHQDNAGRRNVRWNKQLFWEELGHHRS